MTLQTSAHCAMALTHMEPLIVLLVVFGLITLVVLLLGSVFLLLAITTMIRFAHVNFGWTWLWYVAGIVTGMVIIAAFAIIEKKRAEVLRVVHELREWER